MNKTCIDESCSVSTMERMTRRQQNSPKTPKAASPKPTASDEKTIAPPEVKASGRAGKQIMAYIDPDLRDALDEYIASDELSPKLTAVVEASLKRFLAEKGFWPRKTAD